MPKKTTTEKKPAAAPAAGAKKGDKKGGKKDKKVAKVQNPLFEKRTRSFGIGGNIPPTRDLSRFVKWPRYIKLQRQRRVLYARLKVPPPINQFTKTLDKSSAINLFKLLTKYRPESAFAKKRRLVAAAAAKAKGEAVPKSAKPVSVKYGLNHVTHLVEQKKAKLVVIAHDVDPIELVVWLPTLCRKLEVPYVIVKGKARLGRLVHKKTAAVLAVTDVKKEDQPKLAELVQLAKDGYNNNADMRKSWGGGKLGTKSAAHVRRKQRAVAKEEAARQKS